MTLSSDQRKNIRFLLLMVILLTIPCYCLGLVVLQLSDSVDENRKYPQDTPPVTELLNTEPVAFTPMDEQQFEYVTATLEDVTPTLTLAATQTKTFFLTWTRTPTNTATATLTPTHTFTPSITPSETPTETPTETLQPTSTKTPVPSETPLPTETETSVNSFDFRGAVQV